MIKCNRVPGTPVSGKYKMLIFSATFIYCFFLPNLSLIGNSAERVVFEPMHTSPWQTSQENQIGMALFARYCSMCHPNGGNRYKAHLPLRSAPQLEKFETFLTYIRNPDARDGSNTVMMSFPEKILSEKDAREIYRYLVESLKKS